MISLTLIGNLAKLRWVFREKSLNAHSLKLIYQNGEKRENLQLNICNGNLINKRIQQKRPGKLYSFNPSSEFQYNNLFFFHFLTLTIIFFHMIDNEVNLNRKDYEIKIFISLKIYLCFL